ncbi:DUF3857 domain-containing protein [uncultured Croceitalea sp.]|uniref:DUF3857 domain-containing protein n=1 Tax=uncultured Croceitalea sp. TaxID=1798908 RepID=UPI00374F08B8
MIKKSCYVLILLFIYNVNAQDYKFGKVSKEELKEKIYTKDSSASASVLYRDVDVSYRYIQSSGFEVIKEVFERVKIYNKEGFDYATISEKLYQGNGDSESFSSLKAYTYNLEEGEIIKTKLKNSDIFKEELSKYYDEEKFTMPNLKEGSVIEYQYKVTSPFSYSIDEIEMQYDIPIKKQKVKVSIPEYYSFKTNMKGYLSMIPKKTTKSGKINFSTKNRSSGSGLRSGSQTTFSNSSIDYITNIHTYDMQDMPALKDEPYTNNIDNYRASINYEIQFVKFPNNPTKSYATTWESVAKTIYESTNFGNQIGYRKYFKKDLEQLLLDKNTDEEKITAIFSFVQDRMNFNSYIGKYTDEGVKEAYKKQSGSVADINLMLIAMLKEAGLKANPVLVSTRDNGVPLFPTREGYNYVIASVELNGQNILMDACNKYTEPNLLPTSALNWSGRIIKEDGSSESIPIVPEKLSKKETFLNVNLLENGDISGKQRERYMFYNAYLFRNKNNSVSEDDYLDKKENNNGGLEISNYNVKNKKVLGKPIVESFDFELESQADVIGDKIYMSPLLFHAEDENPFKLEKRNYPVDFVFPRSNRYVINITIPEGYKISYIPGTMNIALPDKMGRFTYQLVAKNNQIHVLSDVKINRAIFPATDYFALKEFYKNIVEKQTEQIVLSKIK